MDPIDTLITSAIHYEVDLNKNPYVTLETIIQRLFKKMSDRTRVLPSDKSLAFGDWHPEILEAYETLKPNLSHDEKACVERVLSKDCPHSTELTKFATCWYKYNAPAVCRWFAVDGILSNHPKAYAQEAFTPQFAKHKQAVRALYTYYTNPETIKEIVEKAFLLNDNEPCAPHLDPDFERCVALYAGMVGEAEMRAVSAERKAKLQQQPAKRKKPSSS